MARHTAAPGLFGRVGRLVERRPVIVLIALFLITGALGFLATARMASGDLDVSVLGSEASDLRALVDSEFAEAPSQRRVQLLFDAGEADVIADEPVAAAARVERALLASPDVAPRLAEVEYPVLSFATPIIEALQLDGVDPETAPGYLIDETASVVLAEPRLWGDVTPLYSGDLDVQAARARAGLMLVTLDSTLTAAEVRQVSVAVVETARAVNTDGVRVRGFSRAVVQMEGVEAASRELPLMVVAAMLFIGAVLALTWRSVSDGLIVLTGLVMAVIWLYGFAALLGPGYLGIIGPFTVVTYLTPVVLLAIGTGGAVSMLGRYRHHQAGGSAPHSAAKRAVIAAGGAVVGTGALIAAALLANGSFPVPSVRDFGVLTAVGQLCATVIMLLLIPSAKNLWESRRVRRQRPPRGGTPAVLRGIEMLASVGLRAPSLVIASATALAILGIAAAFTIPAQLDRSDFLPRNSPVAQAAGALDEVFGGDVDEVTVVVVDGDLVTPATANALLQSEATLSQIPGVRSNGPEPILSIAGLVRDVAQDPAYAAQAQALGWTGTSFNPGADVPALYGLARAARPQQAASVLADDASRGLIRIPTTVGQRGAEELRVQLTQALEPLRALGLSVGVTSNALVREGTKRALAGSTRVSTAIALLACLLFCIGYFWLRLRRATIGVVPVVAAVFAVGMVFATMRLLGVPYTLLTVTVASIAVAVAASSSFSMVYRTVRELDHGLAGDEAVAGAVNVAGPGVFSSSAAAVAGFGVMAFSSLPPVRQFGIVASASVAYSMLAAFLVVPSVLVLWTRRSSPGRSDEYAEDRSAEVEAEGEVATVPPHNENAGDVIAPQTRDERALLTELPIGEEPPELPTPVNVRPAAREPARADERQTVRATGSDDVTEELWVAPYAASSTADSGANGHTLSGEEDTEPWADPYSTTDTTIDARRVTAPAIEDDEPWVDPFSTTDPTPEKPKAAPTVPPDELVHRFHVRLEGDELQEVLADVPDSIEAVELVKGGARFHVRGGRLVDAVFIVRERQLLLEPAQRLFSVDGHDLIVPLGELPLGAELEDVRVEDGGLVLAGTLRESARPEDAART